MIDPLLTDCRRIFLRGLSRRVRIGIHDFERAAAQRILGSGCAEEALAHVPGRHLIHQHRPARRSRSWRRCWGSAGSARGRRG